MKDAVDLMVCWCGKMTPMIAELGATIHMDTGIKTTPDGWTRHAVEVTYDGSLVFLTRFTECCRNARYITTKGRWICPVSDLMADEVECNGNRIKMPAWRRRSVELASNQDAQRMT